MSAQEDPWRDVPPPEDEPPEDEVPSGRRKTARRVAIVTHPQDVAVVRQRFVKADWYPEDVVTLIAGRGGEGKSTISIADTSAATLGTLRGDYYGQRTHVALTCPEDSKSMVKARLDAAGADPAYWDFLDVGFDLGGNVVEGTPVLPDDIGLLAPQLSALDAKMWIIDPLSTVIPGDLNKRDVVRAGLDPLTRMARDLHIAVVSILHFGKGQGMASEKISGSHAFRDVARSVLLVAHDEDSGEHVITLDKSNYTNKQGTSWSFTLESVDVKTDAGENMAVPVAKVEGETDTTVNEIINRAPDMTDGGSRNEAQAFIVDYLESHKGEAPSGEVLKAGRESGFSDTELKHARQRCRHPRIASHRAGFGRGGAWAWALVPEEPSSIGATKEPKVPRSQSTAPMAPLVAPMRSGSSPNVVDIAPPAPPEPAPARPDPPAEPSHDVHIFRTDKWGWCRWYESERCYAPNRWKQYEEWDKAGRPEIERKESA